MKTVTIPDSVHMVVKRICVREGLKMHKVVEQALRAWVKERGNS